VTEPCPKCSAPFLLEKTTKKDGTIRYCGNCDYKIAVTENLTESETVQEAQIAG
jgi:DNA topoisomerase-1